MQTERLQSTGLRGWPQWLRSGVAQSQGYHFDGVAEAAAIDGRLDTAEQVDARGDAELARARGLLKAIGRATSLAEAINLAAVGDVHAANAQSLDRIEEEHWGIAVRLHARQAAMYGRRGIATCERLLGERAA